MVLGFVDVYGMVCFVLLLLRTGRLGRTGLDENLFAQDLFFFEEGLQTLGEAHGVIGQILWI